MADYIPTNLQGGFKYTPVSFSFGSTDQVINGGYTFDLPLATVAAFTNSALDFNANNSNAARGFMSGVVSQAQSNLTGIADQSFTLQNRAISTVDTMQQRQMDVQRYAIKKAFKSGGCFITTAVTKAKGLPDDCAELQLLRKFRDDYMLTTEEGKALVATYYAIAPIIVAKLDMSPVKASIYARLDSLFIQPALHRIGSGEFDVALGIYTALVLEAAKLAGVEVNMDAPALPVTCTCHAGKRPPKFHAKTCPVKAELNG